MKRLKWFAPLIGLLFCATSYGATSAPLKITKVRAMFGGDYYIFVENSSFCSTTAFRVDKTAEGANRVTATAMLAISVDKKIQIETSNCTGFGTIINSLFLSP